jgi:hypothetical protein
MTDVKRMMAERIQRRAMSAPVESGTASHSEPVQPANQTTTDDNFQMQPAFQQEAAAVLASLYFAQPPAFKDAKEQIDWWDLHSEAGRQLLAQLIACRTLEDLTGDASKVYDAAKATLKQSDHDQGTKEEGGKQP